MQRRIAAYEIEVRRAGAVGAIIDAVTTESAYEETFCNTFVTELNLSGWGWRVRAIAAGGQIGPWSERRVFTFEPCRLSHGASCHASP